MTFHPLRAGDAQYRYESGRIFENRIADTTHILSLYKSTKAPHCCGAFVTHKEQNRTLFLEICENRDCWQDDSKLSSPGSGWYETEDHDVFVVDVPLPHSVCKCIIGE